MEWALWIAAGAVLAAGLAVGLSRVRTRRTLRRMGEMIDAAIRGDFQEDSWDESLLSSVEAKLARYLSDASSSARNLAGEKEKIKGLIADISHQTKTPLANVLLYTQLLEEQSLGEEGAAMTAALKEQAEKLRFLIDALVKMSRLETGMLTFAPVNQAVSPLLWEAAAQIAPKAEAKGVDVLVEETDAWARFDKKWTAEALMNIVDNGVKYTPSGGHVRLSARIYPLFCRVDVADDGIGVPEEEQAKIFSRFYRSPSLNEREGVGVGLYLAREIIRDQGGYIRVISQKGKGARFSVFLPREE